MSDRGAYGDSVNELSDAAQGAEDLDPIENLTGDDPDEIMQTGYNPPDREPHSLRDAPTPNEEREGPHLDERLAQEEPEISERTAAGEPDPRAGRLLAPDEGSLQDTERDEVAEDVGPAGYASSAEEAAVHIRRDS
jgi:hypothetical protein